MPILLEPAAIVEFSGVDALTFGQAQFSTDTTLLAVGGWHWSAWLDPQGRVRHLFALLRPDSERLLAWLPRGSAADLAKAISAYVFRSKLKVTVLPNMFLFDAEAPAPVPGAIENRGDGWSIGIPGSPPRSALLAPAGAESAINEERRAAWHLADVDHDLPWISSEVQSEFTPQALGLDRLGAVSVGKGCYPGQEIVARLHFRGGNKRACYRVIIHDALVPPPGTRLLSGTEGTPQGTLLHAARADAQSSRALAVLPIGLPVGSRMRLESAAMVEVVAKATQVDQTP